MKNDKQLKQLKFKPKNQIIAARFTKNEAFVIRRFCKKENIKYSDILRYSLKQLIPNL